MPRGGGQDLPPRRNALLGEGIPTRRTSEKICPAQECSPRRRHPDTAHEQKNLPPREKAPLGESLPTRRTSERICPAQEHAPRRRSPDTAHERKDLCRARTLSSAKASRHGARAKGFAPRRNALLGESIPTRRTREGICPAQEYAPRRRPPDTARRRKDLCRGGSRSPHMPTNGGPLPTDEQPEKHTFGGVAPETAHGRKDLPRAGTLPTAKASRHGARAKGFARAGTRPTAKASRHGARAKGFAPRGSPSPHVPTNGGPPSTDGQPKNTPSAGSHPRGRGRCRVHSPKKIRLLHETQLFYGESHVGSPQIFSSFPSVDRCVAQERNPVPPVAPHRGSEHRGLRRDGEMCHGFDEMVRRFDECPHGGELLPRAGNAWLLGGGRYCPGLRCFGERFHRRRCANPDACRAPRCSHG